MCALTSFSGRPSISSYFGKRKPHSQSLFAVLTGILTTPNLSSGLIGKAPSPQSHFTESPEHRGNG